MLWCANKRHWTTTIIPPPTNNQYIQVSAAYSIQTRSNLHKSCCKWESNLKSHHFQRWPRWWHCYKKGQLHQWTRTTTTVTTSTQVLNASMYVVVVDIFVNALTACAARCQQRYDGHGQHCIQCILWQTGSTAHTKGIHNGFTNHSLSQQPHLGVHGRPQHMALGGHHDADTVPDDANSTTLATSTSTTTWPSQPHCKKRILNDQIAIL